MIIDLTVDAAAVERRAALEMDMLGRMSALEACFDSRMRQLRRYLDSRLKGKQSTPESSQAPSLARSNSSSDNIRLPGKNTPVQVGAADRHDTRMRENIEGIFAQVERQKRELQHAIQSVERLAQCTNHLTKAVIQLMDHSGLRGDLRTTLDSEVIPAVATAIFHCTVIQGVGPAPKKEQTTKSYHSSQGSTANNSSGSAVTFFRNLLSTSRSSSASGYRDTTSPLSQSRLHEKISSL